MIHQRAVVLPFLVTWLALPAPAQLDWRPIARGVEHLQEWRSTPTGPLLVNALRLDLRAPGVHVRSALARDVVLTDEPAKGRENVRDLCSRLGAVAAVNADYFPFTGDPLGIAIQNGELVSEPMATRVAMGVTATGEVRFDTLMGIGLVRSADGSERALDGVNRLPKDGEVCILTPVFGARIRAAAPSWAAVIAPINLPLTPGKLMAGRVDSVGSAIPDAPIPPTGSVLVGLGSGADWIRERLAPGAEVTLRFDLLSNSAADGRPRGDFASRAGALRGRLERSAWVDVAEALSGGPWLVRSGSPLTDGREQGFNEATFTRRAHPRTAAGVAADGKLLLVTVDGRQPHSRGVSLPEMAEVMLGLGATDAINLDGGGSTTMVALGLVLNAPSDGSLRPVANALAVFADPLDAGSAVAQSEGEPLQTVAGQPVDCGGPEGTTMALWGTVEGRGWVDQRGVFRSVRSGVHTVVSIAPASRVRHTVTVLPGSPTRLRAALAPAPNNPPDRHTVRVTVSDTYGNGVPGVRVRITARGGTADPGSVTTDASGAATAEVVWDAEKDRVVTATALGIPSVSARPPAAGHR